MQLPGGSGHRLERIVSEGSLVQLGAATGAVVVGACNRVIDLQARARWAVFKAAAAIRCPDEVAVCWEKAQRAQRAPETPASWAGETVEQVACPCAPSRCFFTLHSCTCMPAAGRPLPTSCQAQEPLCSSASRATRAPALKTMEPAGSQEPLPQSWTLTTTSHDGRRGLLIRCLRLHEEPHSLTHTPQRRSVIGTPMVRQLWPKKQLRRARRASRIGRSRISTLALTCISNVHVEDPPAATREALPWSDANACPTLVRGAYLGLESHLTQTNSWRQKV